MSYSKTVLYIPIRLYIIFFIFTLLLFVLGPVAWKVSSYTLVISYLLLCNVALYVGYCIAVQKYRVRENANYEAKLNRLFKTCLILSVLFIIPKFLVRWNVSSLSVSGFISQIHDGLTNPSIVYNDKMEKIAANEASSPLTGIYLLLSPWWTAFFPLAILCFKKYGSKVKTAIIVVFVTEVLSWIGIGTNKGLLDIILVCSFIVFYQNHAFLIKNAKRAFIITIVTVAIFLTAFLNNIVSRYNLEDTLTLDAASNFIDFKLLGFYGHLPAVVVIALAIVSGYLNQGYYALELALRSPPVWTYGFGNSFFTIKIWDTFTGDNLLKKTYMGELQNLYGIDPMVNWHSFYVWFASDITFPGVVLLVFLIGYLLGLSWMDFLYKRSAYAPVAFTLLITMVLYFFANNQVLSFSFIPFVYFFVRWLYDRRIKTDIGLGSETA